MDLTDKSYNSHSLRLQLGRTAERHAQDHRSLRSCPLLAERARGNLRLHRPQLRDDHIASLALVAALGSRARRQPAHVRIVDEGVLSAQLPLRLAGGGSRGSGQKVVRLTTVFAKEPAASPLHMADHGGRKKASFSGGRAASTTGSR